MDLLITFLKLFVGKCGEKWIILYFYGVVGKTMLQFLGNIGAKADAKGRIFVPAIFRKRLQSEGEEFLVLRKDIFQDCLVLYPGSVWEREIETLRFRLNRWNREQQLFRQPCQMPSGSRWTPMAGTYPEALPSDGVD